MNTDFIPLPDDQVVSLYSDIQDQQQRLLDATPDIAPGQVPVSVPVVHLPACPACGQRPTVVTIPAEPPDSVGELFSFKPCGHRFGGSRAAFISALSAEAQSRQDV